MLLLRSLVASLCLYEVCALDNGAARRPTLGYNPWNGFKMKFNASLMRAVGEAMKRNGLFDAGYTYLTLGGSTYQHSAIAPWNKTKTPSVIVRNSSGFMQINPARFPGPGSTAACLDEETLVACLSAGNVPEACGCSNGNEGMRLLVGELRGLGFSWGSYSNMAGCQVPECDIPGLDAAAAAAFIDQDSALYLEEWQSDYLMVDSVGVTPPKGHGHPDWERYVISSWAQKLRALERPVVLHACHAQCGGAFSGPTLEVKRCNESDAAQKWHLPQLREEGPGLCAGCTNGPCANDAALHSNGTVSGRGYGMQACSPPGLGESNQEFTLSPNGSLLQRKTGQCLGLLHEDADQVRLLRAKECDGEVLQQWTTDEGRQLKSVARPGFCLTPGKPSQDKLDPWCIASTNMWRTSTDVLQTWARVLMQVESMVGMSAVSAPGSWAFPDALELGVPGGNILTWEESKSHFALYVITSSPLLLANDVREGRVQQRLLQLVTNRDVIEVNQDWAGFSGDRVHTQAVGKEWWAKPLSSGSAAVVLFNRNGTVGICNARTSLDAPCNDDPSQMSGQQQIQLVFSDLAQKMPSWQPKSTRCCDVTDLYGGANASSKVSLGRFCGQFTATVQPHGVAFLRLDECSDASDSNVVV